MTYADGVFLWELLVIQSPPDGLTNWDRIKDLEERLNETPKDLQDYFKTILFSTESRYRTQTARIFTVAANVKELLLMAHWELIKKTLTTSSTILFERLQWKLWTLE